VPLYFNQKVEIADIIIPANQCGSVLL
jgi:hypothetical protein